MKLRPFSTHKLTRVWNRLLRRSAQTRRYESPVEVVEGLGRLVDPVATAKVRAQWPTVAPAGPCVLQWPPSKAASPTKPTAPPPGDTVQ